jgi:hypothetical protein
MRGIGSGRCRTGAPERRSTRLEMFRGVCRRRLGNSRVIMGRILGYIFLGRNFLRRNLPRHDVR